jgi:hypothetical protein
MSFGVALVPGSERECEEWDFVLQHFRPDFVSLLGTTLWKPYRMTLRPFDVAPGRVVLVSPLSARLVPGRDPLSTYTHPADAVYVFGADDAHFDPKYLEGRTYDAVHIETANDLQMHSYVAGALVLRDRWMKHGERDHR